MVHQQNSARGTFAKKQIRVSASGEVYYEDYSASSALLTAASSGLKVAGGIALSGNTNYITDDGTNVVLPAGIKVSNALAVTANSTALTVPGAVKLESESAQPSARYGPGSVAFVTNSTGKMLALNTTGTTWTYIQVTSVLA